MQNTRTITLDNKVVHFNMSDNGGKLGSVLMDLEIPDLMKLILILMLRDDM